ncbi:hypothetical protein ZWY2020_014214 [Hordeum vulgare]|nr:hypothetical protein ZWY2020_014214 [Hordeum vulgare]
MPLLPSSSSWTLSRSATPFTTATAFRSKLHRASAIVGGGAQALADAVRWEPKRVYGGEAAGAGEGEKFLNLPNLVSIGRMASGPLIGCQKKYAREPSERSRKKQGARGLQQAVPAELQRILDQILS